MTAPCTSCGLRHSITGTDPACAYECHPECGPELVRLEHICHSADLRKYKGDSLRLQQVGITIRTAPGVRVGAHHREPDPTPTEPEGLPTW